ncbi:hypothetical protein Tco_0503332 [Tanacetum coccineum]
MRGGYSRVFATFSVSRISLGLLDRLESSPWLDPRNKFARRSLWGISPTRVISRGSTEGGVTSLSMRRENVDYQSSGRLCNLSFLEYLKLYFFEYEHVAVNSTRHGLDTATTGKPTILKFKRISLTGFRSCTSCSHYWSVLKQTTRISTVTVNTVRYHSDVLAISQG